MFIRWTVVAAARGGPGVDVAVEAGCATTWIEVRDDVLDTVGCDGQLATAAGVQLADHHVVGRFPLLDGAEIAVSPPGWTTPSALAGPAASSSVPVTLVAVSGPDAGRTLRLRPGQLVLGRGEHCDLVVGDPDVSRRHCQIELSPGGLVVRDLSSTNGTLITAPRDPSMGQPVAVCAPVGGEGVTVALGGHITVGSSRLQVRLHNGGVVTNAGTERGDGTVIHTPAPRPALVEAPQVHVIPALPTGAARRRIPWLAAALPLLVSIPIALWWGSPIFLLMGVAGPIIIVGSVLGDRREFRRTHAVATAEHDRAIALARSTAARTAADILAARLHTHPDAAAVLDGASDRGPALWGRTRDDPDALLTRVGVTDIDAPVRVDIPDAAAVGRVRSEGVVMSNAPMTVDLSRGVAVQGPALWREGITRGIVGRVAATVGPEHVRIVVVVGTPAAARRWAWSRWLPHTPAGKVVASTPDGVEHTLSQLCTVTGASPTVSSAHLVLVVADDIPDSAVSRLSTLADQASTADSPVAVLVSADPGGGVPRQCRTRLLPAGETGTAVTVTTPDGSQTGVADHPGPWWAHRLSRALAPLRPAVVTSAVAGLPDSVSLVDLLRGLGSPDVQASPGVAPTPAVVTAAEITRWWRAAEQISEQTLALPLAMGTAGPVVVDLVRDGPHTLIAGTTGAGKSELLRSLVLGLACRYPPAEVSFLLVDFKGGATLADCALLPHSLGLLTDLDVHEARRVLAGLQAEVRRRERLLAAAGVSDLAAYRSVRGNEPLPRLVCVVDEFRVLAEHAPDVLDALVHVAAVGRSLGVHLILATQRPSGVVSADIRANTALRIALRVQDPGDSRDVIDRPDASDLPRERPGRAIISRDGAVETVQTAHASGNPRRGPSRPRVHRLSGDNDDLGAVRPEQPVRPPARAATATGVDTSCAATGVPTERMPMVVAGPAQDPSGIITAVAEAWHRPGATSSAAARAWLPPLPTSVSRQDVTTASPAPPAGSTSGGDADLGSPVGVASPPGRGPALPFALADLPDEQRRAGLRWAPGQDGPLIFLGGPGSGRSTAVAALLEGGVADSLPTMVLTGRPADVWPRGTAVVDWRDADHLDDVLTHLARRAGTVGDDWIVVGIDDCDALLQACGEHPDALERLTTVARDAVAGRIALVMAGGRGLGSARLGTGGRVRVLLRPADPYDAALVGASPRDLPASWPPGRGVMTGGGPSNGLDHGSGRAGEGTGVRSAIEVHVISPQWHGVTTGAGTTQMPGDLPAPLPRVVPESDLPAPSWPLLPLGVAGPEPQPVSVNVMARPGVIVAGPPGSGRTGALRRLAVAAAQCRAAVVVVTVRVDEWTDLARTPDADRVHQPDDPAGASQPVPASQATPAQRDQAAGPGSITVVTDAAGARTALSGGGRRMLVIDDMDICPPEIDDLATAVAGTLGDSCAGTGPIGVGLVVASTATHLGSQFRGLSAEVRRHGNAVLLRPGRHDARDVLSATAPAQSATAPGRGILINRGRARRVQVASGGGLPPAEPPTTVRPRPLPVPQRGSPT